MVRRLAFAAQSELALRPHCSRMWGVVRQKAFAARSELALRPCLNAGRLDTTPTRTLAYSAALFATMDAGTARTPRPEGGIASPRLRGAALPRAGAHRMATLGSPLMLPRPRRSRATTFCT